MQKGILKIHPLINAAREDLKKQLVLSDTVQRYVQRWEMLSNYMSTLGIKNYNREVGNKYLKKLFGPFLLSQLSKHEKTIIRKVEYLTQFQEKGSVSRKRKKVETKFDGKIGNTFHDYLLGRQETGCSLNTILSNKRYLHIFQAFLIKQKIASPGSIKPSHVIAFIETQKSKTVTTQYCTFGAVKGFLKYLYSVKLTNTDLSCIVPKVNYVRQAKLPSVYSKEEIQSLLAVIDRGNPKGKRDYAIMLIGARLGLRASDILGLTFTNILWDECKIVIDQKKTGNTLELPLTAEIGEAIIDYLKHGRPVSELPVVFLSLTPPFGQMTSVAASCLTSNYLALAGIDTSQRKHGTHILRHSLVAELLEKKNPIHVISAVLGHSTTDSSRHYIRIDTMAMQPCALAIPLVNATFYNRVSSFFFLPKNQEEKK